MRIDIKETIALTEQEQETFKNMIEFIADIYDVCEQGGEVEDIVETIADLLLSLSEYMREE